MYIYYTQNIGQKQIMSEQQSPLTMNVNMAEVVSQGTPVLCPCGGNEFISRMKAIVLSKILLGSPEDAMLTQVHYFCSVCDKPFQEIIEERKEESAIPPSKLILS